MSYYHSTGEHLDYTPNVDVPGGSIRQVAGKAGIANVDLPANEVGALCIRGTVKVISDGTNAFSDGEVVGYDESADRAVVAGGGDYNIGVSVGAVAATNGLEVTVLLNGQDNVV